MGQGGARQVLAGAGFIFGLWRSWAVRFLCRKLCCKLCIRTGDKRGVNHVLVGRVGEGGAGGIFHLALSGAIFWP
ncbi:MAG: hypothetical protein RL216_3351 [Pseudomonadota bacterium]